MFTKMSNIVAWDKLYLHMLPGDIQIFVSKNEVGIIIIEIDALEAFIFTTF